MFQLCTVGLVKRVSVITIEPDLFVTSHHSVHGYHPVAAHPWSDMAGFVPSDYSGCPSYDGHVTSAAVKMPNFD